MEDYSVIIRTTGKAGEKYRKLLSSISELRPQPKEVIVVLPEGYSKPEDSLGTETFYFCKKGMVIQRLFGIEKCRTKYALVTDDDIAFEDDFVNKLYEPLKDGKYAVSAGPLLEFFPKKGIDRVIGTIMGGACKTVFHRDRYNTLLRTTGYSYNDIKTDEHKLYETQTAAWTCFFINVDEFRKIHFEDEMWLDNHGYAAHDDTCMFYKCWLLNKTPVIVSDAEYQHLDAGTAKKGAKKGVGLATAFNTYVFWHRYIYSRQKTLPEKVWSKICITHFNNISSVFFLAKILLGKGSKESLLSQRQGIREAKKWIKTEEYKSIPPIGRE